MYVFLLNYSYAFLNRKYSQYAGELVEVYYDDFNPRLGQKKENILRVKEKETGTDNLSNSAK